MILGMSTVVLITRFFDLDTSNPALVAEQSYATGGSRADRYAGYDQFGRIIETQWKNGSDTTLQNARYGYDQSSNRNWRENVLATTGQDNYYTYDDLYQVTSREQANLAGSFPDYTGIQSPALLWVIYQ